MGIIEGVKTFAKKKYGEYKEESAEKKRLRQMYESRRQTTFHEERRSAAIEAGNIRGRREARRDVGRMFASPQQKIQAFRYNAGYASRTARRVASMPFNVPLGELAPQQGRAPRRKARRTQQAQSPRLNLADVL